MQAILRVELRQRLSEMLGPNLSPTPSPGNKVPPMGSSAEELDKQVESASIFVQVAAPASAAKDDNAQKVSQRAFADIDENEENCPPNDAKNFYSDLKDRG